MGTMNFILGAGVLFILLLLGVIFFIPESKKPRRKRKGLSPLTQEQKDWQKRSEGLERHIQSLHKNIELWEAKEKKWEKDLTIEKMKAKKLQEKLSQERQWQQKEHAVAEKQVQEFKALKAELAKVQDQFVKEHAVNLRFQREMEEAKRRNDSLNEKRQTLEAEKSAAAAQAENYRRQIAQLKKENIELTKKNQDTDWVTRSDYMRLEEQLRVKTKEIERLKKNVEKE